MKYIKQSSQSFPGSRLHSQDRRGISTNSTNLCLVSTILRIDYILNPMIILIALTA